MASYGGRNMLWSWRAHSKAHLRIVVNEGFCLVISCTEADLWSAFISWRSRNIRTCWKWSIASPSFCWRHKPNSWVPEWQFFIAVESVTRRNGETFQVLLWGDKNYFYLMGPTEYALYSYLRTVTEHVSNMFLNKNREMQTASVV
jgi:hypothetical protein